MSGLAKDADWYTRNEITILGEEFGPVGPLVIDWLASNANHRALIAAAESWIASSCYAQRTTITSVVTRACDLGLIEDVGSDAGVYRFRVTQRAGYRYGRTPIPMATRRAVLERDGLVCQICNAPVGEADVHIDHIIPVALGGRNDLDNLQVAHSRCNMRKGTKLAIAGMS